MSSVQHGTGTREMIPHSAQLNVCVVCVCVGHKYSADYVYKLRAAVERHLDESYTFLCVTDRQDLHNNEDLLTRSPPDNWPGWWSKINLFNPALYPGGTDRVLYIDIDCVLTGSISPLVRRKEQLVMISNFGPNWRHSPVNSSVMSFDPWDEHVMGINYEFAANPEKFIKELHGDQCFIWRSYGAELIARYHPEEVVSYKYHCRGKRLPPGTKAVVFHGKPDPHEVNDKWVKEEWTV